MRVSARLHPVQYRCTSNLILHWATKPVTGWSDVIQALKDLCMPREMAGRTRSWSFRSWHAHDNGNALYRCVGDLIIMSAVTKTLRSYACIQFDFDSFSMASWFVPDAFVLCSAVMRHDVSSCVILLMCPVCHVSICFDASLELCYHVSCCETSSCVTSYMCDGASIIIPWCPCTIEIYSSNITHELINTLSYRFKHCHQISSSFTIHSSSTVSNFHCGIHAASFIRIYFPRSYTITHSKLVTWPVCFASISLPLTYFLLVRNTTFITDSASGPMKILFSYSLSNGRGREWLTQNKCYWRDCPTLPNRSCREDGISACRGMETISLRYGESLMVSQLLWRLLEPQTT